MTKILVTGGAGYIGSNTVAKLIESGFDVVIVDDLSTGYKELLHPKAKFYQLDITKTLELEKVMSTEKCSAIIHFAAKIVVPESISSPIKYYTNNCGGVLSVLHASKNVGINKIVFSSTAAVYGNANQPLIDENSPVQPINPYGHSKLFSEQMIRDCQQEFNLNSVILRYFNVAGASRDLRFGQRSPMATHLIKIASEAALQKRDSVHITGTDYKTFDGTGIRDYIHVEDLADVHVVATKHLLDSGNSQVFNCGYGKGHSVREVINCMKEVSGYDFPTIDSNRRPGDAEHLVADPSKLKSTLGWTPKLDDLSLICRTALDFEKSL